MNDDDPRDEREAEGVILFVTRNPPNPSGPGGSQRAMHLLRAAARRAPVDLLMLHRSEDRGAVADPMEMACAEVRECRRWQVPEWAPSWERWPRLPWAAGQLAEAAAIGSVDAPSLSGATLDQIAALLPQRRYHAVIAGRLSSAVIVDALIARGALRAERRIADLDDMVSSFKARELAAKGAGEGRLRRMLLGRDQRRLGAAERRVAQTWDGVALASPEDARVLAAAAGVPVETLPNVVDRAPLKPDEGMAPRILFVGHLGYPPNTDGLTRFLEEGWPLVLAAMPDATLDVVGRYADEAVRRLVEAAPGATLHADVPAVEPFYARATLVVVPIWFGSGTRIKIIEAMALGRAVVTTSLGADGLAVEDGQEVALADEMPAFAETVVRLVRDPAARAALVARARVRQQQLYSPAALDTALGAMIEGGR